MAEQFVQVSPDSSGKKIRTEEVTANSQTVEQQVISFADSAGNLVEGTVSAGNSSSTPLAASTMFTGVFEDVKNFAAISISVFADAASANDGLTFDWSHDGSNQDLSSVSTVYAASGRGFSIAPRARYFRIRYINGVAAQATFRLGVVYHTAGSGIISRPLDQAMDSENYAQQVRAVVDGLDGTNFIHVAATAQTPIGNEIGLITKGIITEERGRNLDSSMTQLLTSIHEELVLVREALESMAVFTGRGSLRQGHPVPKGLEFNEIKFVR